MPIWSYFLALPVFGFMILVHELGHYVAARQAGIAVAEFSLGFGPRVASWFRGETEWTLRWIPFGGYVRWHEDGPDLFTDASLGARAWALCAGPLANLVLTVLLLMLLFGPVRGQGFESVGLAFQGTWNLMLAWFEAIARLFQGAGLRDIRGPVGIVQDTAQVVMSGGDLILVFAAFLSLNIGLFNFLPFPGLDGGRLCFLGLERVRRRPLDPSVEGWIHLGGFALLMAIALITTVKDLLA